MLCVSIGRGRHRHMIAEHKHLVERGAKLVELRLDYINGEVNLKRLLADRPSPVIITCRRQADGGRWQGTEQQRLLLLRTAIAEGVEYVDLEEDVAGSIPRFGKTKRILSYHDFRKTPENVQEIHDRLSALDPDIVKLSTMCNQPRDNVRILRLLRDNRVPTVAMCMGDMGTPSRILAARYNTPFVYATFHHERLLAPGQLSFQQMTEIYHHDLINAETIVYGVIGDPIGHSLSPHVHNAALRHAGINAVYVPFRVPAEDLDRFLDDCPELGVRGLSVTIPHKEAVLAKLAKAGPAVKGIGAANTIVWDGGKLVGYNTDYQAGIDSLERAMQPPAYDRGGLEAKTVLVLGAGGAARAIAYGARAERAEVIISGRTPRRAQQLAESVQCKWVDWNNRYGVTPDVIINCTPVGMHPNVDETPYDRLHLRPYMVVFDTVYNPETTLLIKEARLQGCVVVTGVEMFIRQAALQFKHFTDKESPAELMRDVLKRLTGPAKA
jgi:3-dehydroquinate dehydratase / shikimate dehydrogenase